MRPAVALLALVVLAGCSGVTGPSGGTETLTPAPVATPPTATPTASALPPGVTGNGVVDISRLVDAHQTAITNQSYTWTASERTDGRRGNPTGTNVRYVATVANESTYQFFTNHRIVWRSGRPRYLGNYSEFATRELRYAHYRDTENNTQFSRTGPAPARVRVGGIAVTAIERYLPAANATVAVTRVDGQRYYELRGRGIDTPVAAGGVRNYTVSALLRPDGFVRSLTARYRVTADGRSRQVTYEYRYSGLGTTTVERPEWVGRQWGRDSETATAASE